MKNLVDLLSKNKNLILYLVFAFISLRMIYSSSYYHQNRFLDSSNVLLGSIHERSSVLSNYFNLTEENEELRIQLALAKVQLESNFISSSEDLLLMGDTVLARQFSYQLAHVVSKSTGYNKNFLTINKGSLSGIRVNDGVIDFSSRAVGRVVKVSEHFSIIMPIINSDFNLRVRLKPSNVDGLLKWGGTGISEAEILEVGKRISVSPGDTILTSGGSAFFPENLNVGTVLETSVNDDIREIKVSLGADFSTLRDVMVISNEFRKEQLDLEESVINPE